MYWQSIVFLLSIKSELTNNKIVNKINEGPLKLSQQHVRQLSSNMSRITIKCYYIFIKHNCIIVLLTIKLIFKVNPTIVTVVIIKIVSSPFFTFIFIYTTVLSCLWLTFLSFLLTFRLSLLVQTGMNMYLYKCGAADKESCITVDCKWLNMKA